ncbi:MAG TPA: hypothetical protein VHJ20_01505 [Polyangia bacterium]|nr:hypothetical protein [Polyangia bacterium]
MRSFVSLVALGALLAGCGGGPETVPAPTTPRTLQAMPETVWVQPGQAGSVAFLVLGPTNAPLPGAPVSFSIEDDPATAGTEAQGATLAATTTSADASGVATAHLTAGLPTVFRVRATTADAVAEVVVIVAAGLVSSVDVAPFFAAPARAAAVATTIQILFFDNGSCGAISARHPPQPARTMRSLPAASAVSRFQYVSTAVGNAIVGRAIDARGAVVALGCVDLPGPTLVAGVNVEVALPLDDAGPDPTGTFSATTSLAVTPAIPAADAIAAAWRDLTDCPLDPAQRWLDVTSDALGSTSDVGAALAALRGAFITGPDGSATACRGPRTASDEVSADAVALGLFGTPTPQPILSLEAAADDAAHLFDALQVRSTLVVRAGATEGALDVTHTLDTVVFQRGDRTSEVALEPLGLPELVTTMNATVREPGTLVLPERGFTLRLGTAARNGFGALALVPRGLPGDAPNVVAALAGLAQDETGATHGCDALDGALCPRLGKAAGCLAAACDQGLDALAKRLDASFTTADGDGYDLYLAGAAPLLDTHGNGLADRLGDLQLAGQAGAWTVELRPRSGQRALSASWEAIRVGN